MCNNVCPGEICSGQPDAHLRYLSLLVWDVILRKGSNWNAEAAAAEVAEGEGADGGESPKDDTPAPPKPEPEPEEVRVLSRSVVPHHSTLLCPAISYRVTLRCPAVMSRLLSCIVTSRCVPSVSCPVLSCDVM